MVTAEQVVNEMKELANKGKGVDFDGVYGYQCVDIPGYIIKKHFGKILRGNAIDLLNSAKALGFQVIYDAPGVNPKKGDLFVMRVPTHKYGHTGLVTADSDGYTIHTIEQNIDGYSDRNRDGINDQFQFGGVARYNKRNFNGIIGWIRPPYGKQSTPLKSTGNYNLIKENWHFTVGVDVLNVRNKPNTNGKVVATYKKGDKIYYDSYIAINGYVWISYISKCGVRRYVATGKFINGKNDCRFGSFK